MTIEYEFDWVIGQKAAFITNFSMKNTPPKIQYELESYGCLSPFCKFTCLTVLVSSLYDRSVRKNPLFQLENGFILSLDRFFQVVFKQMAIRFTEASKFDSLVNEFKFNQ